MHIYLCHVYMCQYMRSEKDACVYECMCEARMPNFDVKSEESSHRIF